MYNSNSKQGTTAKETEQPNTSVSLASALEKENVSEHTKNDKRYEKPFEDEGACDDDFIE